MRLPENSTLQQHNEAIIPLFVCVCILYLFVKIAAFLFALETNSEEYQFTRQTIYD